jgi:hypothetical protein
MIYKLVIIAIGGKIGKPLRTSRDSIASGTGED